MEMEMQGSVTEGMKAREERSSRLIDITKVISETIEWRQHQCLSNH